MLNRVVVPSRFALIYRAGKTLGYNPGLNIWEPLDEDTAEVIRWLRAGRNRNNLEEHLVKRFSYTPIMAEERLQTILKWCILRRLLYLDQEPPTPEITQPANPLATIYWICTQGCNLRCTYCYQSATVARPNELSTEEGKNLVDQALELGVRTFVFTGGEPFSRHDLLEIASYSRNRGLQTSVITNGHFITEKNVQDVAAIFNRVTISLDHSIPEHHDRHRGQGACQKAIHGIDLLLQSGANVDVNSVLSRSGLKDLNELIRFIHDRPIGQHRITTQFPMGRASSTRSEELTASELLDFCTQISQAKLNVARDEGNKIKPEGNYSTKGNCRNHCGAGLSEISVDPEGWIYPCKLLQYPQFRTANIRDQRLKRLSRTIQC